VLFFLKVDLLRSWQNLRAAGRILGGAGKIPTFDLRTRALQKEQDISGSWMVARPENSPMTMDRRAEQKGKRASNEKKEERSHAAARTSSPYVPESVFLKYGQENPPLRKPLNRANCQQRKHF
jgi:hypothetical protein